MRALDSYLDAQLPCVLKGQSQRERLPGIQRLLNRYDPSVRDYRQRTVIVAVIAVGMVEASVDQVIKVVPMRNRLMAAARAMPMCLIMSGSTMLWVAPIRICGANFNHVFISAPLFHMLQMAVVEIINVILMLNGNMAAARTMHMRLIGGGHGASLSECRISFARQDRRRLDGIEDARNPSLGHLDAPEGLRSEGTKVITRSCATVASATGADTSAPHERCSRHAWRIQLANRAGLYWPIVLTTLDSRACIVGWTSIYPAP